MTFEEMCKVRDPLYAAMVPVGNFLEALDCEKAAIRFRDYDMDVAESFIVDMAAWLFTLAIRALRNQGQPYYVRP